jgi:hypothetical protein
MIFDFQAHKLTTALGLCTQRMATSSAEFGTNGGSDTQLCFRVWAVRTHVGASGAG